MRHFVGRVRRLLSAAKFRWAIIDQALFSIRTLGVTLLVASSVPAEEFGAFSIAVTTAIIVEGIITAACAEPIMARHSDSSPQVLHQAAKASTGFALVAVLPMAVVIGILSTFFSGPLSGALGFLALGAPGLAIQAIWRYVFLASGFPRRAATVSALYALLQVGSLAVLLTAGYEAAGLLVAAWSLPAVLSAAVGAQQAGVLPDISGSLRWYREQRGVILPYIGEFLASRSAGNFAIYAVGIFAGLPAAGAIRAGQVMLGVVTIIFDLGQNVGQVEMVRRFNGREHEPAFVRAAVFISVVCASGAVLYGGVVVGATRAFGDLLLGETWVTAAAVLLPLAVAKVANGAMVGAAVGLRVLLAVRHSFPAKVIAGVAVVGGSCVGAAWGDAFGAAMGLAAGVSVAATAHWLLFMKARRALQVGGDGNALLQTRHRRGGEDA